ncbi:hypothetical protein GCM10028805_11320 [Spirosoma harenae]
MYLNQAPPGLTPQVFAPDRISLKDRYEYGSVFSTDGKEFYYAAIVNKKPQIQVSTFVSNQWTEPKIVIASDKYEYNDPFLSPDGKKLFFISDRPLNGQGEKKDFDIWYLERRKTGWSDPINAGPAINSNKNEYYMSFTTDGTMYFSSNGATSASNDKNYDVYYSKFTNGSFQRSQKLGSSVNSEHYEADVFVSPDESYLIFCGERPDGLGKGDLFISFKNKKGEWQKAQNMGNVINTEAYEFCPFVSSDGKYLFFSRDGDLYWVSADLIKTLR